jgi:hypothetical protein
MEDEKGIHTNPEKIMRKCKGSVSSRQIQGEIIGFLDKEEKKIRMNAGCCECLMEMGYWDVGDLYSQLGVKNANKSNAPWKREVTFSPRVKLEISNFNKDINLEMQSLLMLYA